MSWQSLPALLFVSAVGGVGAYCASCTFHVWQRRNADPGKPGLSRSLRRLRTAAWTCTIAGAAGIVAALLVEALTVRQGVLRGDSLRAERLPQELEVAELTDSGKVEPGDVLVRFRSPEKEGRIASLRLEQERLEKERRILADTPLEPDPEIARSLREVRADLRQLRVQVESGRKALRRSAVETARHRMMFELEKRRVEAELSDLVERRDAARVERRTAQNRFDRSRTLHDDGTVADEALEERRTELALREQSVERIDQQIEDLRRREEEIEEGLESLLSASDARRSTIEDELARNRKLLAEAGARHEELSRRLSKDLERARAVRATRTRQLEIDRRRLAGELATLEESLERRAPFGGRVLFREASPGSARPGDPLVVVAPGEGYELRVRLPERDRDALGSADAVTLELADEVITDFGEVSTGFIERRFPASLAGWKDLPHDAGHGIARLVCRPPSEAVRSLVGGQELQASLDWWPPFWSSPLFPGGFGLLGLGLLGLALGRREARRAGSAARAAPESASTGDDPALTESGAEGAVLRLLGKQLRTALDESEVRDELLTAVEWALDRHRARAAYHIAVGFGTSHGAYEAFERGLLEERAGENASRHRETHLRLARILQAIGDDDLRRRLGTLDKLLQDLDGDPMQKTLASRGAGT